MPTKWISADGREMWLLCCALGGDGKYYSFSVRKVALAFQ